MTSFSRSRGVMDFEILACGQDSRKTLMPRIINPAHISHWGTAMTWLTFGGSWPHFQGHEGSWTLKFELVDKIPGLLLGPGVSSLDRWVSRVGTWAAELLGVVTSLSRSRGVMDFDIWTCIICFGSTVLSVWESTLAERHSISVEIAGSYSYWHSMFFGTICQTY